MGSHFKSTEAARFLGHFLQLEKLTKTGLGCSFGPFFSQTRLVTLIGEAPSASKS
jgi:hypothetical protein